MSTVALAAFVLAFPAVGWASPQIVVYKPGTDVTAKLKKQSLAASYQYAYALTGFAGDLTTAQVTNVKKDPDVLFVVPDDTVALSGQPPAGAATKLNPFPLPVQVVPAGITRIGGLSSPTAAIDGIDSRVNVGVAVLDTGIDPAHPDLTVAGGFNCSSGKSWYDENGHGTHVAGTIGALDNGIGVVGVAPGAQLYGVRVLNKNGSGNISSLLCGVDWVTANAGTIRVANLSLGSKGSSDGNCGRTNKDALHLAICNSVAAGVTYVVAAGNSAQDASNGIPASYPEVITVSAFADFDGLPGGLATPNCTTSSPTDDAFATFSDFGPVVDLSAPGVCVVSTFPGGLYDRFSGTSMSSPHVAGAAALYLATHPYLSPAGVRAALLATSAPGPIPGDPDTYPEGVLNVAGF